MTRRLHACLACTPNPLDTKPRRGLTRHRDRICAACRRGGVTSSKGVITLPLEINFRGRAG